MYKLYYILHIVGIIVWIGSFAAFGYLLRSLIKSESNFGSLNSVINRIRLWINAGVIPSSVIVLISGVLMILSLNRDALPFYMTFMEQAGSLIILFTIFSVSIYSRKLRKKLNGIALKKEKSLESLSIIYSNYLLISAALGLLVIIVVGMRIG